MTSTRSCKFCISLLTLTIQLLVTLQILSHLIHPTKARNIKNSSIVNKTSLTQTDDILVIMASVNRVNVSSIYASFDEFKKTFDVNFPDQRRVYFQHGRGKFHARVE